MRPVSPVEEMENVAKNWLIKARLDNIYKEAVKLAGVMEGNSVLDFGCGNCGLSKFLPCGPYTAYDTNGKYASKEKVSSNWCQFDFIFALNVFEHLASKEELRKTLEWFKQISCGKLVVAIPIGNALSKALEYLFNLDVAHAFLHRLTAKEVIDVLVEEFGQPEKAKRFQLTQYLAIFRVSKRV